MAEAAPSRAEPSNLSLADPFDANDRSSQVMGKTFTLSFAAQGTGHRVNVFRCSVGSFSERQRLTHRELLDALDAVSDAEAQAEDTDADSMSELSVRDVCKVDPQFSALLDPKIDVRGSTVLVNLGKQKFGAVIMKTETFLLATEGSLTFAADVQRRLRRLLQEGGAAATADDGSGASGGADSFGGSGGSSSKSPFQATTLEAILLSASLELQTKIDTLTERVNEEVKMVHEASLFEDPSEGAAWIVGARELKNRITGLASTARGLDHALTEILDEEEDAAEQPDGKAGRAREIVINVLQRSVEESAMGAAQGGRRRNRDAAALLVEFYLGQVRSSTIRLEQAADSLTGHEKFATLLLDHHRNRLLKFDVVITGFSAAVGLGAMVAGIFGMNTPSTIFDSDGYGRAPTFAFPLVALLICSMVLVLVIVLTVGLYCRPRFGSSRRPSTAHLQPDVAATAAVLQAPRGDMTSQATEASTPAARGSRFRQPSTVQKRESRVHNLKELLLRPVSGKGNPTFFLRGSLSRGAPRAEEDFEHDSRELGGVSGLDPIGERNRLALEP